MKRLIENQSRLRPVPLAQARAPGLAGCRRSCTHPPRTSHAASAGLPQSRGCHAPHAGMRSHTDGQSATYRNLFLRCEASHGQRCWSRGLGSGEVGDMTVVPADSFSEEMEPGRRYRFSRCLDCGASNQDEVNGKCWPQSCPSGEYYCALSEGNLHGLAIDTKGRVCQLTNAEQKKDALFWRGLYEQERRRK